MAAARGRSAPPASATSLTLYVAGDSAASRRARGNLAAMLAEAGLEIAPVFVDVLSAPLEAMQEKVFVTPALVVCFGTQRQMVIGDLSRHDVVLPLLRSLK